MRTGTPWYAACSLLLFVIPLSLEAQVPPGDARALAEGLRSMVTPGTHTVPGLAHALVFRPPGGGINEVGALADSIVAVAIDLVGSDRSRSGEENAEVLVTFRALIGSLRAAGELPAQAERSGRLERFAGAGESLIAIAVGLPEMADARDEMLFRPIPLQAVLMLPDSEQWTARVLAMTGGSYPQALAATMALSIGDETQRESLGTHFRSGGITDAHAVQWLRLLHPELTRPR